MYALKPHFYSAKLGFTVVYNFIFLIFDPTYRLWVLFKTALMMELVVTSTHNLCFDQKEEEYQNFSTKFPFLQLKKKNLYIVWACFQNVCTCIYFILFQIV